MRWKALWVVAWVFGLCGCAADIQHRTGYPSSATGLSGSVRSPSARNASAQSSGSPDRNVDPPQEPLSRRQLHEGELVAATMSAERTANGQQEQAPEALRIPVLQENGGSLNEDAPEEITSPHTTISLDEVLRSVYASYPLLRIAEEQRTIAEGQLLESHGEFDFRLMGGGVSGPLGYYQTYRHGAGFEQALFSGGEVFAGYRIGRGNFQPWFGERETNDGGEFKAGFLIPLSQNRGIDERRAAIFRAAFGRDAVEPEILMQLIEFVRAASYVYWDWVAAGRGVEIEQTLLNIALARQQGLQGRVDRGDLPRIELTDNERLIVTRRAALIDAQRKLQQAAIKLSLFYRTTNGQPALPDAASLPSDFPSAEAYDDQQLAADIQAALASRPETQYLDFLRQQLEVDLQQARNLYLPEVHVGATASQDVGAAASATRDKTPFELEASLLVAVPLQRREALGKLQAAQGKLMQVQAKTQFASDKIATDVQNAVAALKAAHARIAQAQESVQLNQTMEEAERRRFEAGDSNLLIFNLREQATADARRTLLTALLEYFHAQADYRAALATVPIPGREP